jgi:hypothetical protein
MNDPYPSIPAYFESIKGEEKEKKLGFIVL